MFSFLHSKIGLISVTKFLTLNRIKSNGYYYAKNIRAAKTIFQNPLEQEIKKKKYDEKPNCHSDKKKSSTRTFEIIS